ncbi:hypothetical protein [Saccharothrix sp. HUAS TT1]|uniref:hypothetical protein n=1 Tax=unclassified Saccharothrix TaxID=2593673 RepID=UPI00345B7280
MAQAVSGACDKASKCKDSPASAQDLIEGSQTLFAIALEGDRTGDKDEILANLEEVVNGVKVLWTALSKGIDHAQAVLDAIQGTDQRHSHRPRGQDDRQSVGADSTIGLGAVRYAGAVETDPDHGEWFSKGDRVNPDGVEFAYFGTGHAWPADSEVPWTSCVTPSRCSWPPGDDGPLVRCGSPGADRSGTSPKTGCPLSLRACGPTDRSARNQTTGQLHRGGRARRFAA